MPSPRNARLAALKKTASHPPKPGKRLGLSMQELKAKSAAAHHSPPTLSPRHAAMMARFRTRD